MGQTQAERPGPGLQNPNCMSVVLPLPGPSGHRTVRCPCPGRTFPCSVGWGPRRPSTRRSPGWSPGPSAFGPGQTEERLSRTCAQRRRAGRCPPPTTSMREAGAAEGNRVSAGPHDGGLNLVSRARPRCAAPTGHGMESNKDALGPERRPRPARRGERRPRWRRRSIEGQTSGGVGPYDERERSDRCVPTSQWGPHSPITN